MPPKTFKDQAGRKPVQRVTNIASFRNSINSDGPQKPDPAPLGSCGKPSMYVLDDHRDNILLAARRGRNYRSIAAQYGVNSLEIWRIVTDALGQRGKKAA